MTNNQPDTIDIYKLLYVLWKRKWFIVAFTVCLSIVLLINQNASVPIYRAVVNGYSHTLDLQMMMPYFDELNQDLKNNNFISLSSKLGVTEAESKSLVSIDPYGGHSIDYIGIDVKVIDTLIVPKIYNGFKVFFKEKQYVVKLSGIRKANLEEEDRLMEQSLKEFEQLKKSFLEGEFNGKEVSYPSGIFTEQVDLLVRKNELEEILSFFSVLEYIDEPFINEKPINQKGTSVLFFGAFAFSCMLIYVFEVILLLKSKFKTYEA